MHYQFDFAAVLRGDYGAQILKGLQLTVVLTVGAWLLAVVIGVALTVLRLGAGRKLERVIAAYVAYHQNVPMLVQILLWYFGISNILPEAVQQSINALNSELFFSVIAIGLCMAAYISEDLRSGLRAIPWGQHEASRSLGMSYMKTMRSVVLPQAFRVATPQLINHSVLLFKNTSLAMAVGCAELSYATREVENHTFKTFESYMVATAVYLGVSLLIMGLGAVASHRYRIPGR